jgi:hypothetical protein
MTHSKSFKLGFLMIVGVCIALAITGCYMLFKETRKAAQYRDTNNIIAGICVASAGSLIMVITITTLYLSDPWRAA